MTPNAETVLGLHPSSRGFGWALFEDAQSLLDWGTVDIRNDKNATALSRIEFLLDKHQPAVLAMERHDAAGTRRSQRIGRLYAAIAERATARGISVQRYSRSEISSSPHLKGARTREEVASAVADCLNVLRPRLPKPRPIWVGERSGMSLFCAAACALTYYASRADFPLREP
jgi:Holliday junction resolvasome RuvABC endonuclease subunit